MSSQDEDFESLLEQSSLGTEGARQLRQRTPLSRARTVRRIAELRNRIANHVGEQTEAVQAAGELLQLLQSLGYSTHGVIPEELHHAVLLTHAAAAQEDERDDHDGRVAARSAQEVGEHAPLAEQSPYRVLGLDEPVPALTHSGLNAPLRDPAVKKGLVHSRVGLISAEIAGDVGVPQGFLTRSLASGALQRVGAGEEEALKAGGLRSLLELESMRGGKRAIGLPGDQGQAADSRGAIILEFPGRERVPVPVDPSPPLEQREEGRRLRGRDALVELLVASVIGAGETADVLHPSTQDAPRVWLLHGPSGRGKTSIAEQVAFEVGKRAAERGGGVDVWWVKASTQETVEAGMEAVARRVVPSAKDIDQSTALWEPKSPDALWQQLSGRNRPWLLVVDGADDVSLLAGAGDSVAASRGWIRPLPPDCPGLVLVTSIDGRPEVWGDWWRREPVSALAPTDAADILWDYAQDRAGTRADAEELAVRLGGLPLALKLAGAYLANALGSDATATFRGYQLAFDNGQIPHLQDAETAGLLRRLCGLSLSLLESHGVFHARRVLRLLSCLADAPVPLQVLEPNALAASGLFGGLDGASLRRTVDALVSLGLVDRIRPTPLSDVGPEQIGSCGPDLAVMHPLVRFASRRLDPQAPRYAYPALAAALLDQATQSCGDPEDVRSWPQLQALAPHCTDLLHALTARQDRSLPSEIISQAAAAAHQVAIYLYCRRLYEQAESEFQAILTVRQQLSGDHTAAILNTRVWLACARRERSEADRGALEQVEHELRAVCDAYEQFLGRLDPAGELGQLAHGGWRTAGGLALLEGEWDASAAQPILDLLDAYQALAVTLAYQDRNSAEAKTIYQAVFEAQKRLLGDRHPKTLEARIGLAARLYHQRLLEEAEHEFRAVYEAERQMPERGANHPDTLSTLSWLASVLQELGRLEEAKRLSRDAYRGAQRVLGADHPETLRLRGYLASVLIDRGRQLAETKNSHPS